ncbi:site-specific integrase [Paenibacillus sp. FSL W7-1287]|uniref:site-specific integrase n=1 Tax=Paenibacillus sp. FSL W7-1287 TaxID=2954538 RepID=UPI0030F6A98D
MSLKDNLPDDIIEKVWSKLLHNKIPQELLLLSNSNGEYYWDKVDEKNIKYFARHTADHPWGSHFALALMCLSDRNLTPSSISSITTVLNARFRDIFTHFNLSKVEEIQPYHIEQYVTGQILSEHSDRQRQSILTGYNTFMFNLKKWIGTQFSDEILIQLSKYILPNLPYDNRDFSARTKAIQNAKTKRKEDTSAVTPLLPEIRAEGHLRWNQISRLRAAFKEAIARVRREALPLPIEFSYDESEYAGERWHFILRDLKGFGQFHGQKRTYREFKDEFCVLEFVRAEKLDDGTEGEGPWFLDLLRLKLLGNWDTEYTTEEHRTKVIDYLNHWGYEINEGKKTTAPFSPRNSGLLIQGFETTRTARLTNKLLINIEPIYVACMFAKFALDIITSSGARMNELLQISYDKDCCVVTVDTSSNPPKKNFIFRLIPKGRDEPENYYMPEEIYKFMNEIVKMLKDSYESDTIPDVNYSIESRKHLLQDRKYIFQYQSKHINEFSINAILRFLLHGLIVQASDGKQVVIKAHLLRHAFATHAVQTEKIPVDIVKTLLHQKDIEVTSYYSAPTTQQITESVSSLYENWVSYVDIQKGILRGPEELKELYDDYREKVGTMSKVVGGICTIDSVCPTKMACVGCGAKIPRPEFKEEIIAFYNWADESEKKFQKLNLPLEEKKMKIAKSRARNELKEIQLIEKTQKDELHAPEIHISSK